jgi:pectate lyase
MPLNDLKKFPYIFHLVTRDQNGSNKMVRYQEFLEFPPGKKPLKICPFSRGQKNALWILKNSRLVPISKENYCIKRRKHQPVLTKNRVQYSKRTKVKFANNHLQIGDYFLCVVEDILVFCNKNNIIDPFPTEWEGIIYVHKKRINVIEDRTTFFEKYKIENRAIEQGRFLAFPNAEGSGRYSKGGRTGDAYWVTLIDDVEEDGSLRYGVNKDQRPLNIFFGIEGTIKLNSPLKVTKGFLTIDGFTPFSVEGITIIGDGLVINAEHVIIRNLKIRPYSEVSSALLIENSKDVIVDSCSLSWAREIVDIDSTNDPELDPLTDRITIQNCFIYEPFGKENRIDKTGIIIATGKGQVSIIKNLCAHCDKGTPQLNHGVLDFANNVIYNWGESPGFNIPNLTWNSAFNFIGNHFIPGPSTSNKQFIFIERNIGKSKGYFSENLIEGEELFDSYQMIDFQGALKEDIEIYKDTLETFFLPTVLFHVTDLLPFIVSNCGAFLPKRDINDERIINNLESKTGTIVEDLENYFL